MSDAIDLRWQRLAARASMLVGARHIVAGARIGWPRLASLCARADLAIDRALVALGRDASALKTRTPYVAYVADAHAGSRPN